MEEHDYADAGPLEPGVLSLGWLATVGLMVALSAAIGLLGWFHVTW